MNTDIIMNNTEASVSIKVTKGDEMRRFTFKGQSFQEIKKIIAEIFSISNDDFALQYEDDEKDRVTLSTDAELKEAIQLHKYVLRFFVVDTNTTGQAIAPVAAHPHPPHHHHPHHPHHHRHEHPHGAEVMAVAEGELPPHPFGRQGPYGRPFGPGPYRGHHGHHHGHHGHHKRRFEKEEKEAIKCERKKWKKQRKSESSSSEDEAHKLQKKEMRELMKATKQSIKANWAPVKEANPAQWPENRQLMVAEIKMAKRIIRGQAYQPAATPAVVVAEQNTSPVVTAGVEMQA